VPDWSSEEAPWSDYNIFLHQASGDSKAHGMFSASHRELHLLGKAVDTVERLVGEPFSDWSSRAVAIEPASEVENALRNAHRNLTSLEKSHHRKDLTRQFNNLIGTLIMGRSLHGVKQYLLRGCKTDESLSSPDDDSSIENATVNSFESLPPKEALDPCADNLSCRSVFLTVKGRVGLGRVVRPGDELVLFAGAHHPYVVRRSPSSDGYELQAPAVVDDCMKMGDVWSSVKDNLEYLCLV